MPNAATWIFAAIYLVSICLSSSATELPQDHAYQRTLRNYLGTVDTGAYAIDRVPFEVTMTEATANLDGRFKAWLLLESGQERAVQTLAVPAEWFSLEAVETTDGIHTPLPTVAVIGPPRLCEETGR